jgi:hypothetical protein
MCNSLLADDWRAHTNYTGGYSAESQQITWLWRYIEESSFTERTLLLQFVTGSAQTPVGGFAALKGHDGPLKFTVLKVRSVKCTLRADTLTGQVPLWVSAHCCYMVSITRYHTSNLYPTCSLVLSLASICSNCPNIPRTRS